MGMVLAIVVAILICIVLLVGLVSCCLALIKWGLNEKDN